MLQNQAVRDGSDFYWWLGWVECCVCGHRQKSAIEIEVEYEEPIVSLECVECGGMTCRPE